VTGGFKNLKRAMRETVVFENRFTVPKFKTVVHNELEMRSAPSYANVIYVFIHLPKDRSLLGLLVELHCMYWYGELDTAQELELESQVPLGIFHWAEEKGLKIVDLLVKEVLIPCGYIPHPCHVGAASSL
jgi:hypothetical protein